jgi:hypothetical protein
MPALSSSPMDPVVGHLASAVAATGIAGAGLPAALAQVADPRKRRGVRHQITTILGLAVCAVLAGCRSFAASSRCNVRRMVDSQGWVRIHPQCGEDVLGRTCSPLADTLRRTLSHRVRYVMCQDQTSWTSWPLCPPSCSRCC